MNRMLAILSLIVIVISGLNFNLKVYAEVIEEESSLAAEEPTNIKVVTFKAGTTIEQIQQYIQSYGAEILNSKGDKYLIKFPDLNLDSSYLSSERPDIAENVADSVKVYPAALPQRPNDPKFSTQWHLKYSGVNKIWTSLVTEGVAPIKVAVIDSGICQNHPDLVNIVIPGRNIINPANYPGDGYGHGCSVAGVIAARINNSIGVSGVTPKVKIMPVKVLGNTGSGESFNVALGIEWAVDNGADYINLSLGTRTDNPELRDAIAYAVNKGVTVVAAAGNNGRDMAYFPADYPGVNSVGAIDNNTGQRAPYSNYGADVDVYLPGTNIMTTLIKNSYGYKTGTSFAAPMYTGVLILEELTCNSFPVDSVGKLTIPNQINLCGVVAKPEASVVFKRAQTEYDAWVTANPSLSCAATMFEIESTKASFAVYGCGALTDNIHLGIQQLANGNRIPVKYNYTSGTPFVNFPDRIQTPTGYMYGYTTLTDKMIANGYP